MAFLLSDVSKSTPGFVGCAGFQPDRAHRLTLACIGKDTRIETVDGVVAAGDLARGMRLWSHDMGPVPILRVVRFWADPDLLAQEPDLRPVRLSANSLGVGAPMQDLIVAAPHRIKLDQVLRRRFRGQGSGMVPAHHLTDMPGIAAFPHEQSLDYVAILVSGARKLRLNWSLCETFAAQASTLEVLFGLSLAGETQQSWAPSVNAQKAVVQ